MLLGEYHTATLLPKCTQDIDLRQSLVGCHHPQLGIALQMLATHHSTQRCEYALHRQTYA